jgi:Lon protease-like protein
MARLPLFPLNTVLFPGATLPLHIFEDRYRTMISRCIDERAPFGVVLIREGEEVGATAEPFDVGTTARVARVQRLPDGRMNIVTLGDRRFRILALDTTEPYLQGDVDYLESEGADTPPARDAAARVAALFGEQFRLTLAVSAQWVRRVDLPDDPGRLADFVAAHLELSSEVKQQLLETLSVPERLRREEALLGEIIGSLTQRWDEQRKKRFAGAALN